MALKSIYVQYGCGFSTGVGWENFDCSPSLRLERVPIVGSILSSLLTGNSNRFPACVRYGDICKGLPVAYGVVNGCYASHILEHLCFEDFRLALANTFGMLAPGGTFRLIVPDLYERARRYVADVDQNSTNAASHFLRTSNLGYERRPKTPMQHLRRLVGNSVHLWMWDEISLSAELERAGFSQIRRCQFGDALDPMFSRVEDRARFFDEFEKIRECSLEAIKPL